ncbi:eukaryotic translation initiation factor 4 gamma 1 isoform X1-like [Tropilaelaps mercedesae]|uniref:Eukaryotic translation initiation factor 4 gamma 1 isoform X1-like n=1 Tax=Tropilaelaps mercedesae TaxID=418985 RepID=A0A1V9XI38_9ACAR|nr:eukaryotic translation initiation factor 4 gamma 1 isoform X1-like [Tropilaelaps mercedesae]
MRPPVNANFPHFSRGMPQSGDMKGGPVGAQGPHGGMPAGPPPPAPTGAPIGGFSPVSQIVAQGVQQIAMAQPGQPNPNQRPQVAYGQFFTSAARSQQGAGYATPSAPSGRPMQMIMPYPRQYFPPAGPYPFYSVTPQAGPQMLATTQSNTMMAPQPTYQAQQAPQRLIPREKKLIPIRNPDTMEEIQLNYVNKKATSGPPQSAISPAPASSVGGPAPVLMNPGGNMNVLPPQTSLVVNPIVPSQPAQPAQPQQQPPPQGQPPQLIPQQQPDSAAPPSIAPTVPQSQPQQQQQPPQAPLLQATPVPKPQPAAVPPPAAHAQQQAHPQQHASGGYSAAPATPSAASTAGINTTIVPQAGLNVPTKDTASTQPLGPPIPGSAVSQTTQVAPDRPAEKREATSDVAQASPASVSPVLSVEASAVKFGKIKTSAARGNKQSRIGLVAGQDHRLDRTVSPPPAHVGFCLPEPYISTNGGGGSNNNSQNPQDGSRTNGSMSKYSKDVGLHAAVGKTRSSNRCFEAVMGHAARNSSCNDEGNNDDAFTVYTKEINSTTIKQEQRCQASTHKVDNASQFDLNNNQLDYDDHNNNNNHDGDSNGNDRSNKNCACANKSSRNFEVNPFEPALNARDGNSSTNCRASGSTADQAEMESPEEAVNDSSEVSENAAAGDREPGSRSSLQREEDEERRKVEVKNEENLRKSQEAKGLSNNQQLPQIEQSILSEPGKDEPAVSTEHAEVPEAAKGDKVTTATVHKKSSEDAGSNEQGSTSGKKDEAAREDNDETNSRQDEEEGEESDESDVELDVDNKTEQSTDSNGKKKYDRDFLLRLQRQPMSMMPPKNMPNLEIFKNSAGNHTLADKPRGAPTGYVDQFAMRNGRGGAPGGSMNRNAKGAQARAGERPKKVITLSSSMSQDVKLHTAEKAWKPIKEPVSSDTDDALYKKFRGILNKLTPQRFDTLLDQVKKLDINSEERLSKVTQLVLEKALNETHFASTYARLCHTLLTVFNVPKITREPGPVNPSVSFRKMLLQKCQYEFETDTDDSAASKEREKKQQEERQGKLDAAKSEQERKEIQDQFNELDVKMKRRTFGLMRFIGELYNLDILNFNIMSDCFRKLMKNPTDEDSIVCACKLFTTVGKKLAEESMIRRGVNETPELKDKHTLFQSLMQNLRKIISENRDAQRTGQKCLPQRVIFMLEDVRDLKDRDWVPRRNEQAPQTLEQIQKDAETEKMLANLSNTGPPSGGGGSRFPPMQSDRNRRPFNSQSQSSTTLRGADFKQAIKNFPNNLSSMSFPVAPSLGPSGPQWVGGASGGGSRNSSLRGTRGEPPLVASANKYDALKGDGPDHPMRSQESSPSRQRERDAALQNVRKMNLGNAAGSSGVRPSGGRGSAPASRDASQGGGLGGSQPGAGSNTTHSLQGTEFEDEKIKRFAQTIISEYTTNGNSEDLVKDFCDRAHINNLNQFLKYFIELSIEAQPRQRTRAGEAIRELHDQRIVSHKHVESVIKEQLSIAEDMVIDIPKYYEYLAEIIAPLFISEGMNFTALLRAVKLVLVPADTTKMLVPLFKRIREISSEGISKKWQASGMNLSELVSGLREQDVKAIEAALGLSGQAATTNPGLPLQELCQRFQTALDTSSTASDLEQALRAVVHQAGNDQRKLTARAFATALLNIGLQLKEKGTTRQQDCTLNVKLLNEKLRLDIEGKGMPPSISQLFADEEVAIQALYALQVVMQENEHPKEATSNFINWLYDKDLLSEEVFKDWAKKDSKKHEPMGYHMTVQHAQGFLTWLSEG